MSKPFFSIIIPSLNGEKHIRDALDSCIEQSFKNYEIIVVCDSCTDNTAEVARSYNAKVIEVDCHRDGLARNAGIDAATGEWILFLDDDDWWLHEFCLQQIWETIQKSNLNTDVVMFDIIWHGQYYCRQSELHYEKMTAGHCFRRSFIGDTRWSDQKYSADTNFFDQLLMEHRNPHFVFMKVPIYFYNYMRPGSLSDKHCKGEL
jgi:glycosyltransferase involved in cell wall biosynthesis